MDLAALMGGDDIAGKHELLGVMARDDARKEVSLGGDDLGVLVGVLVEDVNVALLHEALDLLREIVAALTSAVAVVAVLDVGSSYLLVAAGHELVFHKALDLRDVDLAGILCRQLLTDSFGNLLAERIIVNTGGRSSTAYRRDNPLGIERLTASVTFDHSEIHLYTLP